MIEELIRKECAGVRADRVLDIGPGYASFSLISAEVTGAAEITFVDTSSDVLHFQEEECRRRGVRFRSVLMTLGKDPLAGEQGSFDLIHCQEVLEHLEDPASLVRGLVKILSTGGWLIVTVPTACSERWLTFLNPGYMKNEPHGHVVRFDAAALRRLLTEAGLEIVTFVPAQPHYFIAHTWLFGTRMRIEGSTGKVLTVGPRAAVLAWLTSWSRTFFRATGIRFWGKLLPRNYFVVARKGRA